MSVGRQLRDPLSTAEFKRLPLKAKDLTLTGFWYNLRWEDYAVPDKTFFASTTGRLTPDSGSVPCLYLARERETAFEELYGDFFDAAEKAGTDYNLPLIEATKRVFLRTTSPVKLRVYDLTAKGAAKRIGLDLGTLYAPAIEHTRAFAQRLHDHPARFDGVLYRSRLMNTRCVVTWGSYTTTTPSLEMDSFLKDHFKSNSTIDPDVLLFKRRTTIVGI